MVYRITESDFKQIVSRSLPAVQLTTMQPGDSLQVLHNADVGNFKLGQTYLPKVTIVELEANFTNAIRLQGITDPSHISMHFHLQGESTASIEGFHQQIPFTGGHHNLFYCHYPVGNFEFPVQTNFRYFVISLHPDFIYSRIAANEEIVGTLMDKIIKGESYLAAKRHLPILPLMRRIIEEIKGCYFTGTIRQLYLESKILELFSLQLHHCTAGIMASSGSVLSPKEKDLFNEVKIYLETHYLQSHTLSSIARNFGLNEFSLKKGFKEQFNYTVFGYLLELRLQHAKLSLNEKLMSINEIAAHIGYSSAAHFSTAFKKRFGISPGQYNKPS